MSPLAPFRHQKLVSGKSYDLFKKFKIHSHSTSVEKVMTVLSSTNLECVTGVFSRPRIRSGVRISQLNSQYSPLEEVMSDFQRFLPDFRRSCTRHSDLVLDS